MAGEPLLSVPALAQYTARRGREVLGDLCLVVVTHPDGTIDRAAIDHLHADRATFVASALSVTGPQPPRVGALLAPVMLAARWSGSRTSRRTGYGPASARSCASTSTTIPSSASWPHRSVSAVPCEAW